MKLYLKILSFIKPYWKAILSALLLTLLYVLFNNVSLWVSVDFIHEIFSPEYTQALQDSSARAADSGQVTELLQKTSGQSVYKKINRAVKKLLIQDNRYDTLLAVCLVIFLSFLLKNIVFYLKRVMLNYVQVKVVVDLRDRLHEKLLRLPLGYLEKRHSGELTSVVFNDVNSIRMVLNSSFGKMFVSPVQIIANVIIMIMISWELSLITFVVVPLSTFVIVKIGQSMRRRSRRVLRQVANVLATFQESMTGVRIVKAFTSEENEIKKFHHTNFLYFKKLFRANKLKFATAPINEILLVFVLVFLLWYGGNMVYANQGLQAEDFIRFLVFLFTLFQPIKDLAGINNTIQSGMAAAERIFAIIDERPENYDPPGAVELPPFRNNIVFEKVTFQYNEESGPVLQDINLNISKGELLAIVGPSGSGKTTLVNLIPRFYEPLQGRVLIDGLDIKKVTLKSLRKSMSIVTQDIILFNDTIRNNIAYGLAEVSEQRIIEAAKAANAWEFIEREEKGLDTQIGEKGMRLSGGQKQRLSIARAILKNPPILILDEATSSLDTESERLVQEAVDKLMEKRTVLVIAHRLSTIRNANRIVVLHGGKIEALGKHEQLIKKSAVYKTLYDNQLLNKE